MSQPPHPFFKRKKTLNVIERLASADRLTVFVGAGASAEAGLPTWRDLTSALLEDAAREGRVKRDSSEDVRDGVGAFADWTLETEGTIGGAGIAEAWFGDRFHDLVVEHLYRRAGGPGPTAQAVAQLCDLWEDGCEVLTTNFDCLLEAAIGPSAEPDVEWRDRRADKKWVRHLHGVLTPETRLEPIVLSERDYHRSLEHAHEDTISSLLQETTCLFVGASMSDPTLLRCLYRSNGGRRRHTAVLIRQADDWFYRSGVAPSVARAYERALLRRWRSVRVEPVHADYYLQSAQFVHEVALKKRLGEDYRTYNERLTEWERRISRQLLRTDDELVFIRLQEEVQPHLRRWLNRVAREIEAITTLEHRERLGLHLWVRLPEGRELVLWASSDRTWRDPRTLEPVRITYPSDWVAVKGFCSGTPVVLPTSENPTSRWNSVHAIPVHLSDEPWYHLPVGVLTLASTLDTRESALARVPPDVTDNIRTFLAENAADLLTPT